MMKPKLTEAIMITLFLASVTLITVPVKADTAVWHVYWPGSIQEVVDDAFQGDTIIVHPGIYVEVVWVDKDVTLFGEEGAIIQPDDSTSLLDQGTRRVAIYITADNVIVEGFEIDGTAGHVHYGIYVYNADGAIIRKNIVHDIINEIEPPVNDVAGCGILLFGWGDGIELALVEHNTVYNTGRHGIFIGAMLSEYPWDWILSEQSVIVRNTVYNTWQGPTNDHGGAIQINEGYQCSIVDNLVHHTMPAWLYAGIYMYGTAAATSTNIYYNHVHHNYIGIYYCGGMSPVVEENKVHHNIYRDYFHH